jgi:hypothetical protein
LDPDIDIKNRISEIHQTATGPATSLFIGNFYLDEEVAQAKLRRALAKDSFTWLSGLMALAARLITLTPQKHSGDFGNIHQYTYNTEVWSASETKIFLPSEK